ncbi:hypothetical protein GCM10007276_31540 [Agaricicola taiwanensis]|uniref:Alpha/beta fold hydrolase n=1 Tax=Agaricicola taiwanensis TaxID=591372 RepID=A0A8J2YLN9_9RHOB|nr:alpha/beta fold hydrolase [Agaricicola taiwanensis]GGE52182.1 hypothetical protein GCM10007276_31540 [Agaricicola taiwanensis]
MLLFRLRRLLMVLLPLALTAAGCASRPGAEVLTPVAGAGAVPGARLVTVYVATTREREAPHAPVFTAGRAEEPSYARFVISIPPGHTPNAIEWPRGEPDPATSFAIVSRELLSPQAFKAEVARGKRHDVGVFIHGYNYNFQEALFRHAQMVADANVQGTPILFAWPSRATVTGYVYDRDSVIFSRDALTGLFQTLAQSPSVGNITVFGHSMGGYLTLEALRQLRLEGKHRALARLSDVILAAPDVDSDVFLRQLSVIGPLDPPMVLLVSKDDNALRVSRILSGDRARVGAVDVSSPEVREAAAKNNLTIIDISEVPAGDRLNHDRYIGLVALYGQVAGERGHSGPPVLQAGAFIFNTAGLTLSAPFRIAGEVLGN